MDLRREPYEELCRAVRVDRIEREVGVSSGHGLDLRLRLDPERPLDPVHVPVGLCRRRPDVGNAGCEPARAPPAVIGASSMYGPVPGTPSRTCSRPGRRAEPGTRTAVVSL